MQKIRIHKDIKIIWSVLTNKEAKPLEGRDLTFEIVNRFERVSFPFSVEGNRLTASFPGTEQKALGDYWVTLWENKGKTGQTLVDSCSGFTLVAITCQEDDGDNTLNPEAVVTMDSNIQFGIRGDSAYETWLKNGYTGTTEDFINWLREPAESAATDAVAKIDDAIKNANQAASAANQAASNADEKAGLAQQAADNANKAKEDTDKTNEDVQKAELERSKAEAERLSAETARKNAESERQTSETAREQSEETRVSAENERLTAERARAQKELERQGNETRRQEAENERVKAESSRAEAEKTRESSEESRKDAETKRAFAESERVSAETERATEFGRLKTESETATKNAQDAADIAAVNVLAISFDEVTGQISVITGGDTSAFKSGRIAEDGSIELNFEYPEQGAAATSDTGANADSGNTSDNN